MCFIFLILVCALQGLSLCEIIPPKNSQTVCMESFTLRVSLLSYPKCYFDSCFCLLSPSCFFWHRQNWSPRGPIILVFSKALWLFLLEWACGRIAEALYNVLSACGCLCVHLCKHVQTCYFEFSLKLSHWDLCLQGCLSSTTSVTKYVLKKENYKSCLWNREHTQTE